MNAKPKHRWYQYSLRTLVLVMLSASIGMSWVAVKLQKARRQQEAVREIKKLGGWFSYDYQVDASGQTIDDAQPPGPAWIRNLLGENVLGKVIVANFHNTEVTDAGMEPF